MNVRRSASCVSEVSVYTSRHHLEACTSLSKKEEPVGSVKHEACIEEAGAAVRHQALVCTVCAA